ncbi:unnamed protein product [Brachionus calyciflorus]|uniref:Uncharacterized protein n=1 Tax=Brachionus calyciflorus TaxID=104777 RepID=A0A814MTR0_9BILA|nr:unnamed protein product [Brachionus calyciflorus]
MKWNTQIKNATTKANRVLGCIKKSFKYHRPEVIKLLYTSLVRPNLEYAISSWCPHLEKDINELEKVQRRATKLIPELQNLDYPQRLSILNLTDLRTRRIRGDLIQMYKLINKLEYIDLVNGTNFNFKISGEDKIYNLRRNSYTLMREKVRNCPSRFNFFTNRVVNHWNQLKEDVVKAKQLNSFKSKIDEWLLRRY